MDAILASRLLPTHSAPLFSLPPSSRTRRLRIQKIAPKSAKPQPKIFPIGYKFAALSSIEAHGSKEPVVPEGRLLKCIARQVALTLFCFAIGFAPIRGLPVPAIAAPATEEKEKEELNSNPKGHEYASCTRRLLETVSFLLRSVEEVRRGNGGDLRQVEAALKAVKAKKEELQSEVMNGLYAELRELKRDKERLEKRAEEIVDEVVKTKREYDKSFGKKGNERGGGVRKEKLEGSLRRLEEEYNWIWERVGEIEDRIFRKETVALSFGARELSFIESECEQLVQNFTREMRRKGTDRYMRLHFVV